MAGGRRATSATAVRPVTRHAATSARRMGSEFRLSAMPPTAPDAAAGRIEQVEHRSAGLARELGLSTLILTQVMYVVGSAWVGTGAKLGTAHIAFWLMAAAGFYVPQAAVVIFLSRI